MLGVRTANAGSSKQVRLVRANVDAARIMEHFADIHAAPIGSSSRAASMSETIR